jgi:hypothetical protein
MTPDEVFAEYKKAFKLTLKGKTRNQLIALLGLVYDEVELLDFSELMHSVSKN